MVGGVYNEIGEMDRIKGLRTFATLSALIRKERRQGSQF